MEAAAFLIGRDCPHRIGLACITSGFIEFHEAGSAKPRGVWRDGIACFSSLTLAISPQSPSVVRDEHADSHFGRAWSRTNGPGSTQAIRLHGGPSRGLRQILVRWREEALRPGRNLWNISARHRWRRAAFTES